MPRAVPKPERPDLPPAPADAARRGVRIFDPAELGSVVRWTRGRRQLTQEEAADRLGVSADLLRALELGEGGTRLRVALDVLASLGYDLVLVPRDPAVSLREDES